MIHVDRRTLLEAVAGTTAGGVFSRHGYQDPSEYRASSTSLQESNSTFPASDEDWNTIEQDHLVVHYKNGYQNDAEQILQWYSDAEDYATEELPDEVETRIQSNLYAHAEGFNGSSLRWSGNPIEVECLTPSENDFGESWYRSGLGHEMFNIILWNHAGRYSRYSYFQRNPSWFAEGLSEYLTHRQPQLSNEPLPEGVREYYEVIKDGGGYFSYLAGDRYNGGHVIAEFLVDKYGYDRIFDVLRNDSDTWNAAVQHGFNVSQFELELVWLVWAEENIGGTYTDGFAGLANDVRTGNVETETLRSIIDAWRAGSE